MKFIDYIETDIIDLNIPFRSKKRMFELLATKMGESKPERRNIYEALVDREKIGVTSLGNGVALPHGKCLNERQIKIRIMVLNKPVNYESVDDTMIQLIVCVVFPKETEETHELFLKNIGDMFKKHRVFREIISAKSAKEIKKILISESK